MFPNAMNGNFRKKELFAFIEWKTNSDLTIWTRVSALMLFTHMLLSEKTLLSSQERKVCFCFHSLRIQNHINDH